MVEYFDATCVNEARRHIVKEHNRQPICRMVFYEISVEKLTIEINTANKPKEKEKTMKLPVRFEEIPNHEEIRNIAKEMRNNGHDSEKVECDLDICRDNPGYCYVTVLGDGKRAELRTARRNWEGRKLISEFSIDED